MAYPWKDLTPKDTLKILRTKDFSQRELNTLINLYQPLLKQNALSLYLSLNAEESYPTEGQPTIHLSQILDQLAIGIADFYQARIRLEALGLLEVYRSTEDESSYFFLLNRPLEGARFFNDSILSTLLKEHLSSQRFEMLQEKYLGRKPDLANYENITRSFTDVFQFDVQKRVNNFSKVENSVSPLTTMDKLHQDFQNIKSIDMNFLLQQLDASFVDVNSLTDEIKNQLITYHLLYQFNELDLVEFLMQASDVQSGKIDKQQLEEVVKQFVTYQNREANTMKDFVETHREDEKSARKSHNNELVRQGFTDQEIEIINSAYEFTPVEYLQSIKEQKDGYVLAKELKTLEDVLNQSKLPPEVVNLLIHYVLVIRGNSKIDGSLLHSIANDWRQKGVNSPEKALSYVKRFYQEKNQKRNDLQQKKKIKNYYQKPLRKEAMPKWFTDKEGVEDKQDDQLKQSFISQLEKLRMKSKDGINSGEEESR